MPVLSLAIETSDRNNAVALLKDDWTIGQVDMQTFSREFQSLQPQRAAGPPPGTSSLLMPMIKSLFRKSEVTPQQLDFVSVAVGPGMFTGLRVGVVTAKTMAFALDKPVVAINTLEACAWRSAKANHLAPGTIVSAITNAQRGQIFAAKFCVESDNIITSSGAAELLTADQWLASLGADEFLTGPGLKLVERPLTEYLARHPSIKVESHERRGCDVLSVAALGRAKFASGITENLWDLKPIYFRPSAAEEVRLQNG